MGDIALSDYLAYIFQEISTARTIADRHSKTVAAAYADDEVLRHYPVPRFKIAKLDLTLPVFVSAVQVNTLAKFDMDPQQVKAALIAAATEIAKTPSEPTPRADPPVKPLLTKTKASMSIKPAAMTPLMVNAVHKDLATADDASRPMIINTQLSSLVKSTLVQNKLSPDLTPAQTAALKTKVSELNEVIQSKSKVTKASVENLLVNPETNVVKTGGAQAPLLLIRAELMEEGLFVRSVSDEATGEETTVVEFD